MGVLSPATSGVARRIAQSQNKPNNLQEVNSQSDSDLLQQKRRRQMNPFADSDESDESDFVELSELPALPEKSGSKPNLFPKQKINKSKSTLRRIDAEFLAKYRRESKQNLQNVDEDLDYEDPGPAKMPESLNTDVDYDEPIPHSKLLL